MGYFGIPFRNGVPIGLGSIAGFGAPQEFSPSELFLGGTAGAWYDPSDLSTMFTTSAGTTQCAMPGQGSAVSVGAMLDKRATGYSLFFDGTGDYLSFASNSGLALGAGQYTVELWVYLTASVNFGVFFSVTGGLQFSTNASNNVAVALQGVAFELQSTTPVTLNQWVHLAVTRDSGNTTRIFLNGSQIASAVITTNYAQGVSYANFNAGLPGTHHTGYYANLRVVKGTAVYTSAFTPPTAPLSPISGTSLLTCGTAWSGNPAITTVGNTRIDGLNPFTASPVGNHAIAFNDTTARPELSARVNLLTYSEEFDNAAWIKSDGAVVTNNAAIAPDGTLTADQLDFGPLSTSRIQQVVTAPSQSKVYSIWAKVASGTENIRFGEATLETQFTLTTTWQRLPYTSTQTNANFNVMNSAAGGAKTIYIWGADLRPANIGANVPAYQRIADANTYDTTGFPLYLRFDGIDDSMYTPANLNLSGTDKVTVFAGVRKNADVVGGQAFTELSSSFGSNNGSFALLDVGAPNYTPGFGSRGTATAYPYPASGYSAPLSMVLTGIGNIAAPLAQIRANGSVAASSTASQGTGNYGTYPLYIGDRNSTSLRLNGNIYSLIVVGSAVSAGNISATEQWVAGRTGISIP